MCNKNTTLILGHTLLAQLPIILEITFWLKKDFLALHSGCTM